MRKAVPVVFALLAIRAFAFDWTGRTGVVTLTETAEVTDADAATVAALQGVVLEEADIVFLNTRELTLSGYVHGDGRIVKRGTGDLRFGTPHAAQLPGEDAAHNNYSGWSGSYTDYYTAGGIVVETGDLWFPQDGGVACAYGPVTVAAGATLHVAPDKPTRLHALCGAGTVANGKAWTWMKNADDGVSLTIGHYGDTHVSDFSGAFVGSFRFGANADVTLRGDSFAGAGDVAVYRNDYNSAENHGIYRTPRFGMRPPRSLRDRTCDEADFSAYRSPVGVGSPYYYGVDYDVNYSGRIVYTGEGETTDRIFRFGGTYNMAYDSFDAGAVGGVTFSGEFRSYGSDRFYGVALRGSNTVDMTVTGKLEGGNGRLHFVKDGTGCWALDPNSADTVAGGWFVLNGTLKYASIADVGETCSLGSATNCWKTRNYAALPAYWDDPANRLPCEIVLGDWNGRAIPCFEYTGGATNAGNRRIGLIGLGARLVNNTATGAVRLTGGVRPLTVADVSSERPTRTEVTPKKLYLAGSSTAANAVGPVAEDESGVLSVVKEGTGTWGICGGLTLTGEIDVRGGTLVLDEASAECLDGTQTIRVAEGARVAFDFADAATVRCAITGDGTIVKRGRGTLTLSCPKTLPVSAAGTKYKDHFTTGGIIVEEGVLKLPQGEGVSGWYGPVEVRAGATLFTVSDGATLVNSLSGDGLVTNVTEAAVGSDNCRTLMIGFYGDRFVSDFRGTIGGGIKILVGGNVTLSGPNSTFPGNVSVYLNNGRTVEDLGILRTAGLGMRNAPSPLGNGTKYMYDSDVTIDYGGKFVYVGAGGETTDRRFRFGDYYSYAKSAVDAGPTGGVTFVGEWYHVDNVGKPDPVYLRGSNVQEMVLANPITTIGSKGGVLQFKKTGSGTWRLKEHAKRDKTTGAWFVEEGTLRYDSIADIGENCAFGVATGCYPFRQGTVAQVMSEENRLPYEIELGGANASALPTLEFSGSNVWSRTTDRRIGLVGAGGRLSVGADVGAGRVELNGGVFAAEQGTKTLELSGAGVGGSVGAIRDGQGTVGVRKTGSGTWTLAGDLDFTGPLEVEEGTLVLSRRVTPYRWYRLTITKLGKAHEEGTVDCAPASYYPRLRGIALYTADGEPYLPEMGDIYPPNASSAANTSAGIYDANFWHTLQPGEITIGTYKGNVYCTYLDNLPSVLFGNMRKASTGQFTVWNTYLGSTPGPNNTGAWMPFVFRLPDNAPEIAYYDVCMDQSTTAANCHVATFKLEGSTDGMMWRELHAVTSCVHPVQNHWASDSSIAWSPNANCRAEKRGYRIDPGPNVTDLPPRRMLTADPEVRVASGATLKAGGHVTLSRLTVDCAAAGGTVEGFAFAEAGTVDFVNWSPESRRVPMSFTDCTGLGNLANWTVRLNGEVSTERTVGVSSGGIKAGKPGFLILIDGGSSKPETARLTFDEDFEGVGFRIGASSNAWNAAELVGENQGSFFFDVTFGEALPPLNGQRSILNLRTKSRLGIAWYAYGNSRLTFSFSDRTSAYETSVINPIEIGRTYRLGCTWDGEVVRVYVDGKVVGSGVQPLPLRKGIVGKLYAGPFFDNWIGPSAWADDVTLRRVRVWDGARTPEEVAAENGVERRPLAMTHPTFLTVPARPASVPAPTVDGHLPEGVWNLAGSLPKLIRADAPGKSGEAPSHGFRLVSDANNLYLALTTLFPGRIPYEADREGWTFVLGKDGHEYRFSINAADATAQSRDGDATWSGAWTAAASKEMHIDDSVLWTCEAAIPWTTLGGAPTADAAYAFDVVRDWTLETFAGRTSLTAGGAEPTLRFASAAAYRLESCGDPTCGEYAETYALAASRSGKLTYAVDLARLDGTFEPIPLFTHTYQVAADETLTDSLAVPTAVPGYDALVHTLMEGTTVVMREVVPFDLSDTLVTVAPFFLRERVEVVFKKPFFGRLALIGPDGMTVLERTCQGVDETLPFPRESAAGEYRLQLFDAAGEKRFEKPLDYCGVGEWESQDFHEDWILPGFEPLKTTVTATGFESSLVMRKYAYDGSLLPTSVTSIDEELFAAPAQILVDGEPVACASFAVVSNARHRVGFEATGTAAAATVGLDGWLEYDGVQFNRVTVTPTGKGKIEIRYVLKPAFAKYLHAASGSGWGAKRTERIADGVTSIGSYTTLWTGNEEKGLCFFYETARDWTYDSGKLYRLEKTDEDLAVTVTVAKQRTAGQPFTFEFGLLASPAHPFAPNYPLDTLTESYCTSFNRPGRRPLYDVALLASDETYLKGGDLGCFFGDLETPAGLAESNRIAHIIRVSEGGRGGRLVPYTCTRYLSGKYPEVAAFLPEWTYRPEVAMDYSNSGHVIYDCCPTTTASDFYVWKFREMLRRFPGLKGIYCDFGTVHQCSNADHGCNDRTPILGWREFNRRLIVAQVEAGIENPVIVLHNTDCVQLPAMTFATHLLNGENVRQSSSDLLHDKKDILDTYGYERFACELSSLPWGLSNSVYMPFDTLSAEHGGDEKNAPYKFRMGKASIGACLLHNTMQSTWRNHVGLFDKVLRCLDGFGVVGMRFVGYWRRPAAVTGADDVEVSCWTDGTKVLAVIAQIGKEHHDQDVEIAFDWEKLGVAVPPRTATDRLTADDPDYAWLVQKAREIGANGSSVVTEGKVYESRIPTELGEFGTRIDGFDGKVLRYHLPFHTFGLVELK